MRVHPPAALLAGVLTLMLAVVGCGSQSGENLTGPSLMEPSPSSSSNVTAGEPTADAPGPPADRERFNDTVASSDGTTMVLEDGTEVGADAATGWKSGPNRLGSMQEVADAVDAGLTVRARGRGSLQADGSVLASEITARVRGSATRPFRGLADTADPGAGTFTLQDGRVIEVTSATSWRSGPRRIGSLQELETALLAGSVVRVRGKGVTGADDTIAAADLDARLRPRDLVRFRGAASSVDPTAETVTLEDGTVVSVFDATRWKSGGRWLSSLQEIEDALAAGDPVRVFGKGTRVDPTNVLAVRIRAKIRPGN